jgi:hypothetical protein
MDPAEIQRLQGVGRRYGIGDVVDTGDGVTMTNFQNAPGKRSTKNQKALMAEVGQGGQYRGIDRAKVDSGYVGFEDQWQQPQGSGAVTTKFLETLAGLPQPVQDALDRNPDIAMAALARLERDQDWAAKWGAPREDIQNARRIMSQGPGWRQRLQEGVMRREILPATAIAIMGSSMAMQQMGGQNEQ